MAAHGMDGVESPTTSPLVGPVDYKDLYRWMFENQRYLHMAFADWASWVEKDSLGTLTFAGVGGITKEGIVLLQKNPTGRISRTTMHWAHMDLGKADS